jgi:hypothetical protein
MALVSPNIPAIDYTSKDYSGFISSMLNFATTAFPEWTNQNPGSLEVMLLESFARELDVLSYYGDRIVAESYIGTATQLSSVIQLAQLLGYIPGQALAAIGTVTFQTASTSAAVIVPAATQVTTAYVTSLNAPIIFETQATVTVPANGGTITAPVAQGITQGSTQFTIGNNTPSPSIIRLELLGTSDGSVYQQFSLANNPVVGNSITIYVQNPLYTGIPGSGIDPVVPWTQLTSLTLAQATSLAWSLTVDANNVVTIHFGDNVNGAIPGVGLNVYANYRVGGGSIGNLAANQLVDIASPITGISIIGSTSTTGGTDAEGIDQIRANAPRAFTTQQRAVTLADYGKLALSIPAVSQANAVANTFTNITVYLTATGNTVPAQSLLDQVQALLQADALAGTVVSTLAAVRVPVVFTVNVGVSSLYNPNSVQLQATQTIQNLFAPSNVAMGVRIPVSKAYNALATIPGITFVNITEMQRGDASGTATIDILLQPYEIPFLNTLTVTTTLSS